jgi:hypothetical protein
MNDIRLSVHQKNIERYEHLLETQLSEIERQYIDKRISEERLAMATLQLMSPASAGQRGTSLPGALEAPNTLPL